MSLEQALNHRRAVREYLATDLDIDKVKQCLKLATLAPTSANLQLYEFYHITDKSLLEQLATACLSQKSATTANQMVVFVIRPELYQQRANLVFEFEKQNLVKYSPPDKIASRTKKFHQYYHQLIPLLYMQKIPLIGTARKTLARGVQKIRPMQADISKHDIYTSIHKSCALVAQTFMLAMSEIEYDTCPLEGFDGERIKQILKLPRSSEVSLVVTCGIRSENGVWGDRYRVPFEMVYQRR